MPNNPNDRDGSNGDGSNGSGINWSQWNTGTPCPRCRTGRVVVINPDLNGCTRCGYSTTSYGGPVSGRLTSGAPVPPVCCGSYMAKDEALSTEITNNYYCRNCGDVYKRNVPGSDEGVTE